MHNKETVLVVDDRQDSIDFLTEYILRPVGYAISLALDGEQGLHKALEEKPDLIIMDLRMPKLNGLEVLESLRQAQNNIPVILMTFHGSEQVAVQAFRLGAKDYIIKPYQVEEMQEAIERALAENRLRRERDQLADNVTAMNRQMERRIKEFNVLSGIGKSVTALLDEERLLTRIVEAAVYITGAEEGFLFLSNEESGELLMRAGCGLGERHARGLQLKAEDTLARQVVRTGKPVVIAGARQREQLRVKTGRSVKSLLLVPLKVGDSVIGALSVDRLREDRVFGEHNLYLLSALADYAAVALQNSRLYTQLQQRLDELSVARTSLISQSTTMASRAVGAPEEDVHAFVREGQAHLADLRKQIAMLEAWLSGVGVRPEQIKGVSGQAMPVSSMPDLLQHKLDDILDSVVDGVLIVDQDDRIVMANRMAEKMLGSGLVGKPVVDVCDDPRWSKTYQIVQAAAKRSPETPGSDMTGVSTPLSAAYKMLRASFRIVLSRERKPIGVVVALQDVGAEREARQARDAFITSVSQELRTPVTSIVGYADLLIGESVGTLSQTQRKFLRRIKANAGRIGGLLSDLEGMTIVDGGLLQIEKVDIVSVIRQACDALRPQTMGEGQVLDVDLRPALPAIQADPDAVYHILTGLLRNAHRSSPGKAHIRLEAKPMADGEDMYVAVSVTDAGGGIALRDRERVFNRFQRSDNATIPGLGGSGVGLAIVKALVEAHGGRVWLDSEMGVGSTFTFVLPVHRGMPEP